MDTKVCGLRTMGWTHYGVRLVNDGVDILRFVA